MTMLATTDNAAVHPGLTSDVLDRGKACEDARFTFIFSKLIEHLHGFVRDTELTEPEWFAAIDFLTRTGQNCGGNRQEFILLSDVLGVSMLVDAINHRFSDSATESTVFGPFYTGEQPELPKGGSILRRSEEGEALIVQGTISDTTGKPIADAKIEVWQTAPNGLYDAQDADMPDGHLRATLRADADGTYRFETIMPVSYPIPDDGPVGEMLAKLKRHPYRPAHIHFMISAPGFERLVTHIFIAGDPYLQSDAVFGVKASLIVEPRHSAGQPALIDYDFRLEDAR